MASSARKLENEHARAVEGLKDAPWLRSIGIGLVGGKPGLVVSVAKSGEARAAKSIEALGLGVRTRIQVMGRVRKQAQR
jgi:hypothetical protein